MVYIELGIICGFRYPLGSWNISPADEGQLLYLYLGTHSTSKTGGS
jgi:hypothetical protein